MKILYRILALAMCMWSAPAVAQGISGSAGGQVVITGGGNPDLALVIGKTTREWFTCQKDEDCVSVYWGCWKTAVNNEHVHAFDNSMLELGFKTDSSKCIDFESKFPNHTVATLTCINGTNSNSMIQKDVPSKICILKH